MHLYFLRHGEAQAAGRVPDADRPLTEHGLAQARGVGTMLRNAGVKPDLVLCSPLLRAKQTAETVCVALKVKEFKPTEFLDPSADQSQLFTELNSPRLDTILIIGHNPFIGEAVALLIAGNRNVRVAVGTGTCVCVEVEDPTQSGTGILEAVLPHRFIVASPT
jgi:phosphohistidine phosphatase